MKAHEDMLYACVNAHEFIVDAEDIKDGMKCMFCGCHAFPVDYVRNLDNANDIARYISKKKNIRGINIELDVDTNKTIKKLKAISKHAAALAEELEQIIDKVVCPKCGDPLEVTEFCADGHPAFTTYYCHPCEYTKSKSNE